MKQTPAAPTDAELRTLLGKSYRALEAFLAANAELRPEWKYYGAKLGWSLKLFQQKRNLCFIVPHEGHLVIAFVLGAKAVDAALQSALPETVKEELRNARAYSEGRGVRLEVRTEAELEPARLLMQLKRGVSS